MKNKRRTYSVQSLLVLLCLTQSLKAQDNISARSTALAGADANLTDAWALMVNPSATAGIKEFQASMSYKRSFLLKELDTKSAAFVFPVFNAGNAGIGFTQNGYSLYKQQKIMLSWSRSFAGKFSAGISTAYESVHIADGYGSTSFFRVIAGMQIKLSNEFILAAIIDKPLKEKVSQHSSERIPSQIEIALQYVFSEKLSLHIQGVQQSSGKAVFSSGLEYMPFNNFFLRGGISADALNAAFGFGWIHKNFHVDIAASHHPILGYSPVFSVSYVPVRNN